MSELVNDIQQAVITLMALGAALGVGWATVGRRAWRSVFGEDGWFARLDRRFERVEKGQAQTDEKLDKVIRDQERMGGEVRKLSDGQQAHAIAIAKLQGKEEARLEMAQGLAGASRIAEAFTHKEDQA